MSILSKLFTIATDNTKATAKFTRDGKVVYSVDGEIVTKEEYLAVCPEELQDMTYETIQIEPESTSDFEYKYQIIENGVVTGEIKSTDNNVENIQRMAEFQANGPFTLNRI